MSRQCAVQSVRCKLTRSELIRRVLPSLSPHAAGADAGRRLILDSMRSGLDRCAAATSAAHSRLLLCTPRDRTAAGSMADSDASASPAAAANRGGTGCGLALAACCNAFRSLARVASWPICFAIKTASHITIECSVRHHGRRYTNAERRPGETLHYFRAADDHQSKAGTTTYAQHHKRYDALLSMKTAFERNGALQSRDFETRRP